MSMEIVHRSADELGAEYDASHQRLERAGVAAFCGLQAWIWWGLLAVWEGGFWPVGVLAILGYLAADFVSGLVHWAGDTWGSVDMPVLGRNFIRPFRAHHVDPKGITRFAWVSTVGNNAITTLLVLVPSALVPLQLVPMAVHVVVWFVLFLTMGVFFTNVFHRWAHMEEPPAVARWLQRARLILRPDHHDVHHGAPFNQHYCITAGLLDPLLTRIDFFRRLERLVTRVTGALPRRDDIGEAAAAALTGTT
jgi:hypothetical protein